MAVFLRSIHYSLKTNSVIDTFHLKPLVSKSTVSSYSTTALYDLEGRFQNGGREGPLFSKSTLGGTRITIDALFLTEC